MFDKIGGNYVKFINKHIDMLWNYISFFYNYMLNNNSNIYSNVSY